MKGMELSTLKNMLAMMGASLPEPVEPDNPVAEFIDREVHVLLPEDIDEEIIDIFQGVYVGAANRDPNGVLETLVRVHNDVGDLVKDLQETQQAKQVVEIIMDNLPDKEEDEEAGADLELP